MMHILRKLVLVIVFFLFLQTSAQERYPRLTEYVTDSAGVFTPTQLLELQKKLQIFEEETTNQIVVLTITELGYETIETYANGAFNQNGLGQADKDNGILLLFSKNDREVRIEVGYGLEDKITDAIASRIIRNTIIPLFKEEQYLQGLDTALDELILYLKDPVALARTNKEIEEKKRKNEKIGRYFLLVFSMVFLGVGGFFFYQVYRNLIAIFRRVFTGKRSVLVALFLVPITFATSIFALVFAITPMLIFFSVYGIFKTDYRYLMDEPLKLWWVLVLVLAPAILIALYRMKILRKEEFKFSWLKLQKIYGYRTFSSSSTSSSSSSYSTTSSSSSGGFSGGGGSSGGGGASGSW